MKILITGGAGFIGSHLANQLFKKGHRVVVVDNFSGGKKSFISSGIKTYELNLSSPKILSIFEKEKPEIVYHLAGPINLRNRIDSGIFESGLNFLNNFKKILDYSRTFKIKKIILASSGGAIYSQASKIPTPEDYPVKPDSIYGLANLILEKLLEEYSKIYKLNFVILRFGNIYGPKQWKTGVIPSCIISILDKKPLIIKGDGKQTRDFLYIDDATAALALALKTKNNRTFNVGSGKEISLNKLLKKINKILNTKTKPNYYPSEEKEIQRSALDCSKIKKELGWQPETSLEKGLKQTIKWFKNNKKIY